MLRRLLEYISPALTGAGAASLLLAIVGIYSSSPNHWTQVSLIWSLTIESLLCGLIASLLHFLATAKSKVDELTVETRRLEQERDKLSLSGGLRMPRIIRANANSQDKARSMLLVQASPLFGIGLGASIYFKTSDGFDVLLGEGRVETIQDDTKLIQLVVTYIVDGYDAEWNDIRNNVGSALRETSIKPGSQAQ